MQVTMKIKWTNSFLTSLSSSLYSGNWWICDLVGFLTWEKVMNLKILPILNIVLVSGGEICSFLMVSFIFKFLALLNRNLALNS